MSSEARCLHDMIVGTCGICQPRETPEPAPSGFRHVGPPWDEGDGGPTRTIVFGEFHIERTRQSKAVMAKYPGRCQAGGDDIEVGDMIVFADEYDTFVHTTCR